jgi:hypothetical protein
VTRRAAKSSRKPTNDTPAVRFGRVDSKHAEARNDPLRPVWLFAMSALLVATPLLPSESATREGTGTVLIAGWLVFLIAWLIAGAWRGGLSIRQGPIVLFIVLFVLLHSFSALVMGRFGQPRYALNMLWQWVTLAICFTMVLQTVRKGVESRAFVAVGLALVVCLSAHGYYQYFHTLPQTRRAYEKDPEKTMRDAGVFAPPGSVEYSQFRDRVASTEPFATFVLANSLAALLTPWLIVVIGVTATNIGSVRGAPGRWVAVLATVCLILGCWVLTKSRAAWGATVLGLVVLAVYGWIAGWWRVGIQVVLGAVAALVLASVFGVATGSLDPLVISESAKSLLYRTEYWQATFAMIRDYPWLGCGPGNFQQYYAAYKLPAASETVSDPHNFVLEIWATAGTPTLVAFVLLAAAVAWRVGRAWPSNRNLLSPGQIEHSTASQDGPNLSVRPIYWGALGGLVIAFFPCGFLVGFVPDMILFLLAPLGGLVIAAWHWWVLRGEMPPAVLVCAVIALLVTLLVSGGISYAGVSASLWLLTALTLIAVERPDKAWEVSRAGALTLAIVGLAVGLAFHQTMYAPILSSSAHLNRGFDRQREGALAAAEVAYEEAAKADPYSEDPWQQLAELYFRQWLNGGDAASWDRFQAAVDEMLRRNVRSYLAYAQTGDWALASYRRHGLPSHLEMASTAYRQAVARYPNSSFLHAQLAWAYHLAGKADMAQQEAAEALRLDRLHNHKERKLAVRYLSDPSLRSPSEGGVDAEQLMQQVRKSQEQGVIFDGR